MSEVGNSIAYDVIKSYSNGFPKKLDIDIIIQCAPLIVGEKISNILITEKENYKEIEEVFYFTKFSTYLLYQGNRKIIILVYNQKPFLDYIKKKECIEFLEKYGYSLKREDIIKELLGKMAIRFSKYMKVKQEFPHELGILLGYPLKDVQGFIENKGKNCLYRGYWKVYSDLQKALITFEKYHKAKSMLLNMLLNGVSTRKILGIYQCFTQDLPLQRLQDF